ncbi:hypothetical protein [Citricoccus sp.]|uniref:hypothetical protein n=1 Tax=Citricoccus sp. TaxID=1978372 RepID=UPI0028BD5FAC|nr:hypothetical protein [Citricoccus sp.]
MARTYATEADLTEWTGAEAPANAVVLLRSASTLVEQATRNAVYGTFTDGMPSQSRVIDAFRDATCAQASFWAANGLDPAAGSLSEQSTRVASSKSIKGASVSYDAGDTAATKAARVAALSTLCEEAFGILDHAGLITAAVR